MNSDKLRETARNMQKDIDGKMHPAIGKQRTTARRARIAAGMFQDGLHLQRIQQALFKIADGYDAGTLPPVLIHTCTSKSAVSELLSRKDAILISFLGKEATETPQQKAQREIKELERELIGCKIPGYFPTPRPIVEKMLAKADLKAGQFILEPSAGKGNIADAIKERMNGSVNLTVIERNHTLQQVLEHKGYHISHNDFLEYKGKFDRIVMNPPFEHFQDIDHIQHAYKMLTPGGRLVSIICESAIFRTDKKAVAFREWVDDKVEELEDLPAGAFYDSERPTGVKTRIITLIKEA